MTNREIISRIRNALNLLNKDEHISERYILNTARTKAAYLITQKLDDKGVVGDESVYKTLKCFKLKPEDIINCGIVEFRRCRSLMKSVNPLPDMIHSKYKGAELQVYNIEDGEFFLPISLKGFLLSRDRRTTKYVRQPWYYVQDNYLYLPNSTIEMVNLVCIPTNLKEMDTLSGCSDNTPTKSILDYEFNCPDKLLDLVIRETIEEIYKTFRSIKPDENPNRTVYQRDRQV